MSGKDNSFLEDNKKQKKGRNKGEIRKDNKGRTLYENESQDADGRYIYTYYDKYHKRKKVQSWKLQPSDKLPVGKKDCKSLRELEREVQKDLHDNIDRYVSKSSTLNDRFDLYMETKIELKPSTKNNYIYMYNKNVREDIGRMAISDINYSTMKKFYNDLIKKKGFAPNSIDNIHTLINPVFTNAILDELIRTNPCTKAMSEIRSMREFKKSKKQKRKGLSANQQKALVDFISNDEKYSRWVNVLKILLGTGLRIGECVALVWDNISFEDNVIYVEQNLLYRQWENGECYYRVSDLKTENAERTIPMFNEVREILLKEKERQDREGHSAVVIDGYTDWIFSNRDGNILSPSSVNKALTRISRDYNNEELYQAQEENRPPRLLPHITNHILRHTFCTRLAEMNFPIKVAQEIMGHGDFETTMDIYTSVSEEHKQNVIKEYDGKMYLG